MYIFVTALTNSGRLLTYTNMKSTLKIELDGSYGPMITASVSTDRKDMRDDVMNRFFQSLEGNYSEPDNTQQRSYLCFVEGFGREREPESYIHTIHPIRPGDESSYINRLQLSQAESIIKLAFQMFDKKGRDTLIGILSAISQDMDKRQTVPADPDPNTTKSKRK